jgi:hypothetical protein
LLGLLSKKVPIQILWYREKIALQDFSPIYL